MVLARAPSFLYAAPLSCPGCPTLSIPVPGVLQPLLLQQRRLRPCGRALAAPAREVVRLGGKGASGWGGGGRQMQPLHSLPCSCITAGFPGRMQQRVTGLQGATSRQQSVMRTPSSALATAAQCQLGFPLPRIHPPPAARLSCPTLQSASMCAPPSPPPAAEAGKPAAKRAATAALLQVLAMVPSSKAAEPTLSGCSCPCVAFL